MRPSAIGDYIPSLQILKVTGLRPPQLVSGSGVENLGHLIGIGIVTARLRMAPARVSVSSHVTCSVSCMAPGRRLVGFIEVDVIIVKSMGYKSQTPFVLSVF